MYEDDGEGDVVSNIYGYTTTMSASISTNEGVVVDTYLIVGDGVV